MKGLSRQPKLNVDIKILKMKKLILLLSATLLLTTIGCNKQKEETTEESTLKMTTYKVQQLQYLGGEEHEIVTDDFLLIDFIFTGDIISVKDSAGIEIFRLNSKNSGLSSDGDTIIEGDVISIGGKEQNEGFTLFYNTNPTVSEFRISIRFEGEKEKMMSFVGRM